jgi:DNA-binding beta-propeller fold protein YncE
MLKYVALMVFVPILWLALVNLSEKALVWSYASDNKEYSFSFKWGSKGFGDGQFIRPHDVEFDSSGNIYISDRDLNNIQKFDPHGKFISKWGSNGSALGQFTQPYSISIDSSDNLFVVDKVNNRIQKFDTDGNFTGVWNKVTGSKINETLYLPEDMALDPNTAEVYIADTGNNRIVKFDSDFNFLLEWGSNGTGPGQFDHPHGIGVDSAGMVYVNDLNSPRIQKYDSEGNFIKEWGSKGKDPGQFTPPLEHLFVDRSDNVWLVDGMDNPQIQKFDSEGNFITAVGSGRCIIEDKVKENPKKMSQELPCDGKLEQPEHALINSKGDLYVVDRGNHRIVVYS